MEQAQIPIIELFGLILFLGAITFLLGTVYQIYILYRNKKSICISLIVILLTRTLTVVSSYLIWSFWILPFDIMFLFLYLPGILPELILSPLILKLFGNKIYRIKS